MFLFDTLLYFSATPLTILYLVSHQELHEFPELRVSQYFLRELGRRIVQMHANFEKFTFREIAKKPPYSGHLVIAGHFFQEPQVSAID